MDIKGRWIVSKVMTMDEKGMKFVTAEEIAQMEPNEDNEAYINALKMLLEFTDDKLIMYVHADEHRAEAEEEGLTVNEEGLVALEEHEVKTEDGRFFVEMGEEDGETNYEPLELNEDGEIQCGFVVLKRA